MTIEQFNTQFGIAGQVEFVAGNGGLPMIQVKTAKAKALISIHAGQVLSYQPTGEPEDVMFLSAKAYYQDGKAIKGGAPVCWPWFGAGQRPGMEPAHGFARTAPWTLVPANDKRNARLVVLRTLTERIERALEKQKKT